MSRYTKEQRDKAAEICAVSASSLPRGDVFYDDICDALGWNDGAFMLANEAWDAAGIPGANDWWSWSQERDAEAEALLRTGWEPGQ